ncbi:hypothetical protein BT96DRAFT_999370 [Gymnopus androsaceus JB14]|uniref:DUF6589 domain-containing protein n=1 Tax=Gymnopus androsaceus JB14 TaxID=1447944 RepID=A0A6A4H8I4_9AGAR|nr:hypothetical protein BT96DRAFT_999370 [Gymnopus androsaceus JB14]
MFRSVGSNKYAVKIITLLYNLKHVWPPKFADIMRDNHLVNISGIPDHFMAIDMNIEHHIGYVKSTYATKGLYADWDHLSSVSAAIVHIQEGKKKVGKMVDTSYQRKSGLAVNTDDLVWEVVWAIEREGLLDNDVERKTDRPLARATDSLVDGSHKLKVTVAALNRRTNKLWGSGLATVEDEDEDEIAPMQWGADSGEEESGEKDK